MDFVTPPDKPSVNVLLYGPPKTGKSAGATSAPGPVLYLNADTPNATRYVHRRFKGQVREIRIPPYVAGQTPVFALMAEIATEASKPEGEREFNSVVIDPVGELHRRLMEEFSGRAIRPSINIYGDVTVHLERFCRFLCESTTCNVILIAHDHPIEDEAEKMIERLPYTGTKNPTLGSKLLGMVDIVGYTGVAETEDGGVIYAAQLIPGKGRRGGDRFDALGRQRAVNITEWVSAIEAAERVASEPAQELVAAV